jgi:regulatory protein YycI of two-component signal transduction system YycFG
MKEEIQELSHAAWPGFKKAFIVVFALLTVYLIVIFLSGSDTGNVHH